MPIAVIIIIILIITFREINNRKKLEEKLKNNPIIGYDTQTGVPLYKGEKVVGYNTQTGAPIIEGRKEKVKPVKEKKPIDKSKISNSILMFVGAGLVVFATIVFLSSSWDSIPNIIKPFIILFIQAIFFGSAKICTEHLDIPKTGKVFKILGFMFIPLFLISFSCFNLVGEYLSIEGEYYGIFFAISFIISDIIFKLNANKTNDKALKIASYFIEICAIISLNELLEVEYCLLPMLAIFTIIIDILVNKNILDNKAYNTVNKVSSYVIMGLAYLISVDEAFIVYYLPAILYAIYFFIKYFRETNEEKQSNNLLLFFINYVIAITIIGTISVPKYFAYLLFLIPIVLFARLIKREQFSTLLQYGIAAVTTLILTTNVLDLDHSYFDTLTFLFGFMIYVLLYILFRDRNPKAKPVYKNLMYASLTLLLLNICFRLDMTELAKYVLFVVAILVYLLEKAFTSLNDQTTKHTLPILLCLESIILVIDVSASFSSYYLVLIPLILLVLLSRFEDYREEYVIVPAICSLIFFTKGESALNIGLSSSLILIYSVLSALKNKVNIYTIVSILTIIIGLPNLNASAYIVFLTLLVWSIIHIIAHDEHKDIFKLTGVISALGIYVKALIDLDVGYISIYFLGAYLALISITKLVIKKQSNELTFFECFAFIVLTLATLIMVNEPIDGIIMIIIYFMIILLAFVNKYKPLLYCSLASMIAQILKQTFEYWDRIPIYIYILIIGIALIAFAMHDEKNNKKKEKEPEKIEEKSNIE